MSATLKQDVHFGFSLSEDWNKLYDACAWVKTWVAYYVAQLHLNGLALLRVQSS